MENSALASTALSDLYRAYIDCLNRQGWHELGHYVDEEVEHNGRPLKLSGRNTDEFSTPSESCMPPSPIHRRSVLSIADS